MTGISRVLVIGLDGATLDLIGPWAEAGYLPTLADLMSRGGYGRLRSVLPLVSSAAWTTFMTGANPGKHGVFDFVYRDADSYRLRPVTSRRIALPTLWRVLGEQGRRVGVLNVPMTYPPEAVNGFLVSGLGTPDFQSFTYPPELGKDLQRSGYRINRRVYQHWRNEEAYLQDTYDITERLTDAALSLLRKGPWDFFFVVYRGTDEMAHAFWRHMDPSHPEHDLAQFNLYGDAILNYYQVLDRHLGDLIAASGDDTTVFVVSDHGSGPLYKEVFLNEWLRQEGYLASRSPSWYRRFLGRVGLTRSNISRFLRELHMARVESLIKNLLGDHIEWLPRVSWTDFGEGIDWPNTRAYSFGYQGQIYVNLAGREPQGIVESGAEYELLRDELIEALGSLTDPADGQPIVDAVLKREEIYQGPHLEDAPDLLIIMRDFAYITRLGYEFGNSSGEIVGTSRIHESGGHRLDGILIAAGPGIATVSEEHASAWLGDIAPTILHVLGCAVPSFVDGQVLRNWLVPSLADQAIRTYPSRWNSSGSTRREGKASGSGDEEVLRRLSDLGYL